MTAMLQRLLLVLLSGLGQPARKVAGYLPIIRDGRQGLAGLLGQAQAGGVIHQIFEREPPEVREHCPGFVVSLNPIPLEQHA